MTLPASSVRRVKRLRNATHHKGRFPHPLVDRHNGWKFIQCALLDGQSQFLADGIPHHFLLRDGENGLDTLPIFANHFRRLVGMVHVIELDPADKGADNDIAVVEDASQLVGLHAHREDGAERSLLAAVVQEHDLLQPDHALVGDDVVIVAPIYPIPNCPHNDKGQ